MKSFNAFTDRPRCGAMIDWIFVSRDRFKVVDHVSRFYEGQVSDHNPLMVNMEFLEVGEKGQKEDYRRQFNDCRRSRG